MICHGVSGMARRARRGIGQQEYQDGVMLAENVAVAVLCRGSFYYYFYVHGVGHQGGGAIPLFP
jgi:hypothetical protein